MAQKLMPYNSEDRTGGYHFLRKGVPNLQKVIINKIVTPHFTYFGNKNFMTPMTETLPPI